MSPHTIACLPGNVPFCAAGPLLPLFDWPGFHHRSQLRCNGNHLADISLHQEYQTDSFLLSKRSCKKCRADVTGWLFCRQCEAAVELHLPRRLMGRKDQALSDAEASFFEVQRQPAPIYEDTREELDPLYEDSQKSGVTMVSQPMKLGGSKDLYDDDCGPVVFDPPSTEDPNMVTPALLAEALAKQLGEGAPSGVYAPRTSLIVAQYSCCRGVQAAGTCAVCGDAPITIRVCCGRPSAKTWCSICSRPFNEPRPIELSDSSVSPEPGPSPCGVCGAPGTGGKYCKMCGTRSAAPSRAVSRPPSPPVERAVSRTNSTVSRVSRRVASMLKDTELTTMFDCDDRLKAILAPLWDFLTEQHEQSDPTRFGKRLPLRRLYLMIASISVGLYLFRVSMVDHNQSPEAKAEDFLKDFDGNLTWPRNGTAFNDLLDAYGEATDASDDICLFGWSLLLFSVVCEPMAKPGVGLQLSRGSSALAMVVLFIGITTPAGPNYVDMLDFDEILPYCAPVFNNFVDHLIRNLVGLACSAYFAAALFVMLLSISPALVRVSKIILCDRRLGAWKTFPSPLHLLVYKRNILIMMAWGSLLAPMLCFLPMLIFYQFYGDAVVGTMFIAFTMLPIAAAFLATPQSVLRSYALYLIFYFLPLVIIMCVEAKKHHFSAVITRNLRDPMTYVEIAAEITLANVVVSDVIYLSLSTWS